MKNFMIYYLKKDIMKKKQQSIDDLVNAFNGYLKSIHRSASTFRRYRHKWLLLKEFMSVRKMEFYDREVERSFLNSELGDFEYYHLNKEQRDLVNIIEALAEFQETGRISGGKRKHHPREFHGPAELSIKAFIDYKNHTSKLADSTIHSYIFHLHAFCTYLNDKKIRLKHLKYVEVVDYLGQLDPEKSANKHVALNILKSFLEYLYDQNILPVNYSRKIPRDNYSKQSKLPSTFTDQEISTLLTSIDRGNAKGKRDYAMLLLAIRLGLRASDICELTFDNLIWERNTIGIIQHKTGKALELPLLPEIGNAIVDYLKLGRPASNDKHCFIHISAPYERINASSVGDMVRRHFTRARIDCSNRKHGSHSLRHSLASALLKEKVSLPIISAILGHSSMESTMNYLRIDMGSLKSCALEVPLVLPSFYVEKGGYDHE